jgi:hypothetical protein
VAGLVRNERNLKAVRLAIANSNDVHLTSCESDGLLRRFPSRNHPGTAGVVTLSDADSTCSCPQFKKTGVCKHVAYALLERGSTKQTLCRCGLWVNCDVMRTVSRCLGPTPHIHASDVTLLVQLGWHCHLPYAFHAYPVSLVPIPTNSECLFSRQFAGFHGSSPKQHALMQSYRTRLLGFMPERPTFRMHSEACADPRLAGESVGLLLSFTVDGG